MAGTIKTVRLHDREVIGTMLFSGFFDEKALYLFVCVGKMECLGWGHDEKRGRKNIGLECRGGCNRDGGKALRRVPGAGIDDMVKHAIVVIKDFVVSRRRDGASP